MERETFDRARAAAMARRVGVDFGASLTVALAYIGDRLGVFKLLAAGEPMTSRQVAERTGLNERYIREWASAMAAAGYIEYHPTDATFRMNREQAMVLTREDNTFFTGGAFQYAVACYRQIGKLMDAFRTGGGVPFADFGPEIVEAIERLFHVGYEAWVAEQWIPAVPGLKAKLEAGAEAAEVGCGAGQCIEGDEAIAEIKSAIASYEATGAVVPGWVQREGRTGRRHLLGARLQRTEAAWPRLRV